MISIIIPNYNGAKFLREAIDSALDQQGVELEVIVVDDGSTDDSREIIESYGDRIRTIFQHNQGACAARNAGLAIARGESVFFLDSDDLLYPDALQGMSLELDQLGEGYALYGDARWMQQEALLLHDRSYLPTGLVPPAALIGQNILTGRVLHRMSNVRSVGGFDISLPRGQEFDLHFRLALQGVTFVHFPADVLYYRIHSSEYRISSKGFSGNDPNYFLQLNAKHTEILNQSYPKMWPDQVRTRMAKRLWEIGRGLIREGGREQAVPYFEAAMGLSPMNCISGGRVYVVLARLLGPIYAERIGSFITSNYSD
jgi:glycosyltransferase involved in cell wall biosynthesis